MRAIPADLVKDVVTSPATDKTYVTGRAALKTLSALQGGQTVVGTPLNTFADTLNDALPTAFSPARGDATLNGRRLDCNASSATGLVTAILYDKDLTTGLETYVGKIQFQLPSTTHTQRFLRLIDNAGTTGWRILFGSIGTIASSGGLFSVENVDKADFVQGTPTLFPVATAAGQKAVYWHQETGGTNNLTVFQLAGHERDAGLGGGRIVVINGLVATPNFYYFDSAVAITTVLAGGVTSDWYTQAKTGTITGLSGTFLLLNNGSMCIPSAESEAPVSHQGVLCLFIPTSSNMGLVKVSDILPAVTTFPSYTTRDLLDVANTNAALTPATMHFSQTLQRVVFQLSAGSWVVKKFKNMEYELVFGTSSDPQYRNGQPVAFQEWGATAIVSTYERGGWLFAISNTAGQNGVQSFDLRSLYHYGYSKTFTKVMDVPRSKFVGVEIAMAARSLVKISYKLSDFSNYSSGWLPVPEDRNMSGIVNSTGQIRFMIEQKMTRSNNSVPAQMTELFLITEPDEENDLRWRYSKSDSSDISPARVAFSQVGTWTGTKHWTVNIYIRDTGALHLSKNTQDHTADFKLSANDGLTFATLAGPLSSSQFLNVLALDLASPPGDKVDVVIKEKV